MPEFLNIVFLVFMLQLPGEQDRYIALQSRAHNLLACEFEARYVRRTITTDEHYGPQLIGEMLKKEKLIPRNHLKIFVMCAELGALYERNVEAYKKQVFWDRLTSTSRVKPRGIIIEKDYPDGKLASDRNWTCGWAAVPVGGACTRKYPHGLQGQCAGDRDAAKGQAARRPNSQQ